MHNYFDQIVCLASYRQITLLLDFIYFLKFGTNETTFYYIAKHNTRLHDPKNRGGWLSWVIAMEPQYPILGENLEHD